MENEKKLHSYIENSEKIKFNIHSLAEKNLNQFRFRNMIIYLLLFYNLILTGYILYDQNSEKIYVVVDGTPLLAELRPDRIKSRKEIDKFIRQCLVYMLEINKENYLDYRKKLMAISSKSFMAKIMDQEKKSSLIKAILSNSADNHMNLKSMIINDIERHGRELNISFTVTRKITLQNQENSYDEEIAQQALIYITDRPKNKQDSRSFGMQLTSLKSL